MYELNNLQPAPGARKKNKRRGRGPGSGNGTTAGKGMKGQKARSGGGQPSWFEGGQMPLYRRVPKRGFKSPNRVENAVVNLQDFERLDASRDITPDYLREAGLVKGPDPRVKVLGRGELSAAFRVHVHAVSRSARSKIEGQGGSVEILHWSGMKKKREASRAGKGPEKPGAGAPSAEGDVGGEE